MEVTKAASWEDGFETWTGDEWNVWCLCLVSGTWSVTHSSRLLPFSLSSLWLPDLPKWGDSFSLGAKKNLSTMCHVLLPSCSKSYWRHFVIFIFRFCQLNQATNCCQLPIWVSLLATSLKLKLTAMWAWRLHCEHTSPLELDFPNVSPSWSIIISPF